MRTLGSSVQQPSLDQEPQELRERSLGNGVLAPADPRDDHHRPTRLEAERFQAAVRTEHNQAVQVVQRWVQVFASANLCHWNEHADCALGSVMRSQELKVVLRHVLSELLTKPRKLRLIRGTPQR